jgi:hypothetical protein
MEIGVPVILLLIAIAIWFGEDTKIGRKFTLWGLKTFCDIDLED